MNSNLVRTFQDFYLHLLKITVSLVSDLHKNRYKCVFKLSDRQVWCDHVTDQWVCASHMAGQVCDSSAGVEGRQVSRDC